MVSLAPTILDGLFVGLSSKQKLPAADISLYRLDGRLVRAPEALWILQYLTEPVAVIAMRELVVESLVKTIDESIMGE